MQQNRDNIPPKKHPRLDLPFVKRKRESGEWIYDHRVGIFTTVIIYLLFGIFFLSSKIMLDRTPVKQVMYVDLQDLERLEKELRQAEELNRRLNAERSEHYERVSNAVSNDNASLDDNLHDAKNTNAREIYDSADEVQNRIRANRERYEQGLREEKALREGKSKNNKTETVADRKVQGRVTVSFSLTNPLRHSVDLYVPAYKCRGQGEVTVIVTVNRNGDVTAAEVDKSLSTDDYCMTSTAVSAALASRFDVNMSAPTKQTGTISYIFMPQ